MTLEPDGQATGCNPVEVGSTPTGLFVRRMEPASCEAASLRRELVSYLAARGITVFFLPLSPPSPA